MAERLAKGLGVFSLGLGLAQLASPRHFARMIGVPDSGTSRGVIAMVGARELVAAAGILTRRRPSGWLWARVAGDTMDLALLGAALTPRDARRGRITAAMAAVVGVAALDLYSGLRSGSGASPTHGMEDTESGTRTVKQAVTVRRSPEEVYRFWQDFQNLPSFMGHLESVTVAGEKRSHWVAKGPVGRMVKWDAEVTEDRPNELIAWRSLEGADVSNGGTVRFRPAPGDRGTEVQVELWYDPPGGTAGALVAKLFGEEPSQQVYADLRRFKQVMETGEVVRSDATLRGAKIPQDQARPPGGPR